MRRRRRHREGSRGRSRGRGCLLWAVLVVVVLAVLAVMFGGFQKGTKTGSLEFTGGQAMVVRSVL